MVLLVVDTQKLITNEKLYNFKTFENNVKSLIQTARENQIEVIYVRHDDGEGCELTKGTDGFEIYEGFQPQADERIFDKNINSAFRGTGLVEYLQEQGEQDVIVVGVQTDYCMDATIKCGFEHGFHMIVPAHANTTIDNKYMTGEQTYEYYNQFMWDKRYAECVLMENVLQRMKKE